MKENMFNFLKYRTMKKFSVKIYIGNDVEEKIVSSKEEIVRVIKESEPGSAITVKNDDNITVLDADLVGFGKNITSLVVYKDKINLTEEELGIKIEREEDE